MFFFSISRIALVPTLFALSYFYRETLIFQEKYISSSSLDATRSEMRAYGSTDFRESRFVRFFRVYGTVCFAYCIFIFFLPTDSTETLSLFRTLHVASSPGDFNIAKRNCSDGGAARRKSTGPRELSPMRHRVFIPCASPDDAPVPGICKQQLLPRRCSTLLLPRGAAYETLRRIRSLKNAKCNNNATATRTTQPPPLETQRDIRSERKNNPLRQRNYAIARGWW